MTAPPNCAQPIGVKCRAGEGERDRTTSKSERELSRQVANQGCQTTWQSIGRFATWRTDAAREREREREWSVGVVVSLFLIFSISFYFERMEKSIYTRQQHTRTSLHGNHVCSGCDTLTRPFFWSSFLSPPSARDSFLFKIPLSLYLSCSLSRYLCRSVERRISGRAYTGATVVEVTGFSRKLCAPFIHRKTSSAY